ncbi:MAG: ATP synthase subunit I [Limnochordia bacterium]|jgi:hypothetical protein|nr:ATP synthase subunit I [Limnochordia bacterium]MDD2630406.1 ATP synthase subunit I [Limnochordia bacterium]MDD4517367.1 ATP synthase subunit I [Limnochordia bacterium]
MTQTNRMQRPDQCTIRTVQKRMLVFGALLVLLSLIARQRTAVYGFMLGGITALLQFRALELSVTRQLKLSKKSAVRYARTSYLQRAALACGAILVSLIRSEISFLATVVGLLLVKPAIYSLYFEEWVTSFLKKDPQHGR